MAAGIGSKKQVLGYSRQLHCLAEPSNVMSDLYFGIYPATVVSTDSPEFGSVEVVVPKTNDGAVWAKVVFPVNGQDLNTRGLAPGTPVVVAFLAGDPQSPFILGTFTRP
jgi:Type VI secretion system/phage-baseplate injector OB domain